MNRERAEACLRLQAEAELRRAAQPPGSYPARARCMARMRRVAQVLTAAGALDEEVAEQVLGEFGLALGSRQSNEVGRRSSLAGSVRRSAPFTGAAAGPAAPGPVVPIGQMITVRGENFSGEMALLSYAQPASRGLLTMIARPFLPSNIPFGPFTARDDKGNSYVVGFHGSDAGARIFRLLPDPPHRLRWLDLTTTAGEPATRIDLEPAARRVAVSKAATSPGEYVLNNIAMLLLTVPPAPPLGRYYHAPEARPLARLADGLGDVVAALQACEALSPLSPVPGQLAALCATLNAGGHGITAPPAGDLPEPWLSVLAQHHGGQAPAHAGCAAAAVALPELDGVRLTILGLYNSGTSTVLYLHASGLTWDANTGPVELNFWPTVWVHDSDGRWHATRVGGWSADLDREVTMHLEVVPRLSRATGWIEVLATGPSTEVRATLPLRWG